MVPLGGIVGVLWKRHRIKNGIGAESDFPLVYIFFTEIFQGA